MLDRIYFCPHHPARGFAGEVAALKIACECRKPRPGLLLQAAAELSIDLQGSSLVGDRLVDIRAARAANVWLMGSGPDTAARMLRIISAMLPNRI